VTHVTATIVDAPRMDARTQRLREAPILPLLIVMAWQKCLLRWCRRLPVGEAVLADESVWRRGKCE